MRLGNLETHTLHYGHYVRAGHEGPAIVILHGWAASLKQWEWLLPILADAGYTAYALDLPGHGDAPRLSRDHNIEDYLGYLGHWMQALDIRDAILLGHSMGGYLSLQYALDHPGSVRALILVDPLYDHHQLDVYHQLARRLMSRPDMLKVGEYLFSTLPNWLIEATYYLGPPDVGRADEPLRRQVTLDHKRADPHILHTLAIIGDLRPHLWQITAPTLVAWGSRDQLLSPASFQPLVDLLPAAQGHCFASVGHHPHLACTQSFTELVTGFLRRFGNGRGTKPALIEVDHLWTATTPAIRADR